MTQDNITDGVDATDESVDSDSAVLNDLRRRLREAEKRANSAPTRESIEAEIRSELARESAISEQLVALGHPAGMSSILKGTLGDAEVTREAVAAALQGIGYQVAVDGAPSGTVEDSSADFTNLAEVVSLSARVQAAATGTDDGDVMRKIQAATTPAELQAIMAEQGLLVTS